MSKKPTIAIAGASGFIGRWFIEMFHEHFYIIGLSRKISQNAERLNVEWRTVDLYSLSDTRKALKGVDFGLYLVHSMQPHTRLTQGSFEDMDLLLADNFRLAAESNHLKQIIYVGGIIPENKKDLSRHLSSRLEVENVFKKGAIPLTSLRASIIIGPGGSSFQLLSNLLKRLPILICPSWTQSICQPVDVRDLLKTITQVINNPEYFNVPVNVGGPQPISYLQLMKSTSQTLGLKRLWMHFPMNIIHLSKWWVSKFSSTQYALVSPLIESLVHDMKINEDQATVLLGSTELEDTLAFALHETPPILPIGNPLPSEKNTVRSTQRIHIPKGYNAKMVGAKYTYWLEKISLDLLRVKRAKEREIIQLFGIDLIELSLVNDKTHNDRMVYFVTGGLLVKRKEHGWLEFRKVLDDQTLLITLHEFVPSIPWPFYRVSQAVLHLWVMKWFGKYVKNLPENEEV